MKKFYCILMMALVAVMSLNAQTALQEQKLFDNVYFGINGGVTTPLSFDEITPLNPTIGIRLGKDFTPVFGINVEGTGWLGSHVTWDAVKRFDIVNPNSDHFAFRSTNVGVNGTVNFTNLFHGYKGLPRTFEVVGIAGVGWWHTFFKDAPDNNDLSAKTGLDLMFNLGGNKAHALYIEPAIVWNLGSAPRAIQFNKNYAQFGLSVGYNYRFKTSNGTHNFKIVDYADRSAEIDALNAQLNELRSRKPEVIEVEKIIEVPVNTFVHDGGYIVTFAKGSSALSREAKGVLNSIPRDARVEVVATASPDGNAAFNNALSQERADVVSLYLMERGVKVLSSSGIGVTDETSQRIARIILK